MKRFEIRIPRTLKINLMEEVINFLSFNGVDEYIENSEVFEMDTMWPVIMELPEKSREVVVLYYYEQFTTKEISKMLAISEGTVKSRLSRSREKLIKLL